MEAERRGIAVKSSCGNPRTDTPEESAQFDTARTGWCRGKFRYCRISLPWTALVVSVWGKLTHQHQRAAENFPSPKHLPPYKNLMELNFMEYSPCSALVWWYVQVIAALVMRKVLCWWQKVVRVKSSFVQCEKFLLPRKKKVSRPKNN